MSKEKMTQALRNVKAIIWDYDGVHYDYKIFPPLEIFDDVRAIAAQRVLPMLTLEESRRIGEEGYKLYGDTVHNYVLWAQANGLDAKEVRRQIFKNYHIDLFNYLARYFPTRISEDKSTIAAFERCAPFIKHGLVTHSSVEHWAGPHMRNQSILKFFNEKAVIGLDDMNFKTKTEDVCGLKRVMKILGVEAHETMFVEDSMANLRFAKSLLPDLTTTFAHHGAPLRTLPDHLNLQVRNPKTLLQAVARAHGL